MQPSSDIHYMNIPSVLLIKCKLINQCVRNQSLVPSLAPKSVFPTRNFPLWPQSQCGPNDIIAPFLLALDITQSLKMELIVVSY
jgi:hypothetical protein